MSRTIQILIASGADPDARFIGRSHQETPLHWAASSDDVEALDALLDAGANVDSRGGVMAGGTPLDDARIFGQWKTAQRLVERGATTQTDDEAALGLIERLTARLTDAELGVTADELDQAFWYACHGGQLNAAILLAEQGANIDWTPPWEPLTPLDADGGVKRRTTSTRVRSSDGWRSTPQAQPPPVTRPPDEVCASTQRPRHVAITGDTREGGGMARPQRVILWVVLSIIAVVVLVVLILWLWAIVTGGKYM